MEKEKDVWSFKTSDLVAIPNIITYVRFVLIIPFVYFFLAEQYICGNMYRFVGTYRLL